MTILDRARQRDHRRYELYLRLDDGQMSFEEFHRHGNTLARAAEDARDEYVPDITRLWQYCDRRIVARAKLSFEAGAEAVRDANHWLPVNPWFANMIATGTALAARGQTTYFMLLRDLQERIERRLGDFQTAIDELPNWDSRTGKLTYQGRTVRNVRALASRVRAILDVFQTQGWQSRADSPATIQDDQALRETLKVLNKGLSAIRFRADGTGKGIFWERLQ